MTRLIDVDALPSGRVEWDDILEAPTVDAEPVKHAYWIWKGEEGNSKFMCSRCGTKEDVPTCNGEPTIWVYCPMCGARMMEE